MQIQVWWYHRKALTAAGGAGERGGGLFLFHLLSLKDKVFGKPELPAAILCCVLCCVCV